MEGKNLTGKSGLSGSPFELHVVGATFKNTILWPVYASSKFDSDRISFLFVSFVEL